MDSESGPGTAQTAQEISAWRTAERARLIKARLAISAEARAALAATLSDQLAAEIGDLRGHTISLYWPFRGELDLRPWMPLAIDGGARIALPVVIEKGKPLEFRAWAPGQKLEKGVWDIPVPVAGPAVTPTVAVAPLVGFDAQKYRLGYGGGFYDRTLAALPKKPLIIGVGYESGRLASILPQWHDIPMDRLLIV